MMLNQEYSYCAIAADGRRQRGRLRARHPAELDLLLQQQGLELLTARPQRNPANARPTSRQASALTLFCLHLEQLLSAGLPMLEALAEIQRHPGDKRFAQLLAQLIADIEAGAPLSQALANQPAYFEPAFVGIIQAGESSGQLPAMLMQLYVTRQWQEDFRRQTRQLLLTPLISTGAVCAALAFLLLYTAPQLQNFLTGQGLPLPWSSRLLFACAGWLAAHWLPLLLTVVSIGAALTILPSHHPAMRRWLDERQLGLPLLGPVLLHIELARLAQTLAQLYRAGLPLLEALAATRQTLGNHALIERLEDIEQRVFNGQQLATAFADHPIFPPLLLRMLHLGESNGCLDATLEKLAQFYTRDSRETLTRLQSLLAPGLTLGAGLLLGWTLLAIVSPLYDLIGQIGSGIR